MVKRGDMVRVVTFTDWQNNPCSVRAFATRNAALAHIAEREANNAHLPMDERRYGKCETVQVE